jgi:hypothetical protein
MQYVVVYKPLAQIEAAEAYQWYGQPHIGMGGAFLDEFERTNSFIAGNPHLYACVESEIRRANLNRFPYSLYYVIDGETVNVLSCFYPHREPKSRQQLLSGN